MAYFKNVKINDEVTGLIFGKGKVSSVLDKDSFYTFIVEFENGYEIPYTEEGIPAWGDFDEQTLFYSKDIDLSHHDHEGNIEILPIKEIIELKEQGFLEIKSPSGIWQDIRKCDEDYIQNIMENKLYFLLREKREQ